MNMEDTPENKKRKRDGTKDVYPCDKCEYSGSKTALYRHKQSKHEGIRYPCDQCEYAATMMCSLIKHKESIHKGIRYPCDQCEYAATEQGSLKRHKESMHEGIRYPCDQCDYTAKRQDALKHHKESMHEGIIYPCDQCEYTFNRQDTLKQHKVFKHDGIRYSFDKFMIAATNLGNLRKHKQSIQKERVETPVKQDESEVKQEYITEEEYVEPIETPVKKEDCHLESKIKIEEDMYFIAKSSDSSEFIQEINKESSAIEEKMNATPQTVLVKVEESVVKQEDITGEDPLSDSSTDHSVSCSVCSKVFKDSSMLPIHMWIHVGQDINLDKDTGENRSDLY